MQQRNSAVAVLTSGAIDRCERFWLSSRDRNLAGGVFKVAVSGLRPNDGSCRRFITLVCCKLYINLIGI